MRLKPTHRDRIIKECTRSGLPIPDSCLTPYLEPDLQFYVTAFNNLHSERAVGFGEGPIPTLSILNYGSFYGCSEAEIQDLLMFVRVLDNVYLKHVEKKAKKKK